MSILETIENRTENWKTALYFSPMFRDSNLRLALAKRLGEPQGTQPDDVHLELYWKGMRDYLHQNGGKTKSDNIDFAERYKCLFPNLHQEIEDFGRLNKLKDLNYDVSMKDSIINLGNNLANTEIDIVLESPSRLFIGEAKHEMDFSSDGSLVLVHQLIRQYVMAKILICRLESNKEVIPFVVGDDAEKLKRRRQIGFMVHQGWLKEENILEWDDVKNPVNDLSLVHRADFGTKPSSPKELEEPELNRDLAHFFGEEATERFHDALMDLGIHLGDDSTDINLSEYEDVALFATSLANAFKILLDTDNIARNANRADKFADELRCPFLNSPFHEVHSALFGLSRLFSHVWIKGKRNYGVRTAHKNHRSGVSLLRSRGPDRLEVGKRR